MTYLNILIGFSFIMLVFAIGVSVAQALLTRLLSLKAKAVVGHPWRRTARAGGQAASGLLGKLQELWAQSGLPAEAYHDVAAALTTQLTTRGGKHALTLHASSVGNLQVAAAILRQFGKEELPHAVVGMTSTVDLAGIWESMVQAIEQDWAAIAPMTSASYTANTKRYLLGVSAVVVLLFNVDAIRILRILAVDPNVRTALVTDAARVVAAQPAQTSPAQPASGAAQPASTSAAAQPASTSGAAQPASTSAAAQPASTSGAAQPASTSAAAQPASGAAQPASGAAQPASASGAAQPASASGAAQPASTSGAASAPDAGTVGGSLAQLTRWQKQNVAELKATGLPLGWELAPLWVCQGGATATYQQPCSGDISPWDTVLLWLMCLLGLALGIGLVSQGAPFWFSLLQTELGIKNAAGQAAGTAPATTMPDRSTTVSPPASPAQPPPGPSTEPASPPAPATSGAVATGSVLITDIYSGEGTPKWTDFMASNTFSGVILKATDGVSFILAKSWFVPQWQAARSAAGTRYRQTCFLGAYHWLEFYDNPEQQADYYCSILEQVGWGAGDMLPIVDVEFGSDGPKPVPNYQASVDRNAKLVIDCTSRYAAQIKKNLGSDTRVVLYSGQVLRELQINNRMGCDYLWMAQYGVSKPDLSELYSLGWTDQQIVMWQYTDGSAGNNKTKSPQLPDNVPGMGNRDCSVFRDGDLALFKSMLIKR